MATDISSPNLYSSVPGQVALNQWGATSGRKQPRYYLDSIIQGELDAAERRRSTRALELERQRQFDISQQNAIDTAASQRKAGLVGSIGQLGTTAATLRAITMKGPVYDATGKLITPGEGFWDPITKMWKSSPSSTTSATGLPATTAPTEGSIVAPALGGTAAGYTAAEAALLPENAAASGVLADMGANTASNAAIAGDTMLSTSVPSATGLATAQTAPTVAGLLPTNVATTTAGVDTAATAPSVTSGIVGKALPIAGYIGGALAAKNIWGGKDIPWDEKTTWQKATTAPGTAGGALPLAIGAKVFGDDSAPGVAYREVARIEQQAMKPIEAVFNWIGGLF
jgi:hypothetical protein